jgi:DNA-directed RNA polymerase specialized sigma24 family protein
MSRTQKATASKPELGGDVVSRLEREWLALSQPVSLRLREWGAREPTLARFRSPDELIRFLLRPGPWAARDAVLAALLAQARVEPLAARVVLAAVLPGLKRIAEEVILDARDREELWQLLLACAWERIRSYPLERRPTRIAANLLLDARRRALDAFTRERGLRTRLASADPPPPAPPEAASADVEVLLAKAVRAGALAREEARLILETRFYGVPLASIATARGASYDALRIRRRRAERRLLLFLGHPDVRFGRQRPHYSSARVVGAGLTGSAGGGAVTHPKQRR